MEECDYLKCYEALSNLEDKIEQASKIEIHYKPPYETKYAVIEFCCRKEKPLKVASYYIYGEELKTGEPLICWHWQPSMLFNVIEDNFVTEKEAIARLKKLRRVRRETNN